MDQRPAEIEPICTDSRRGGVYVAKTWNGSAVRLHEPIKKSFILSDVVDK